MALGVCVLTGKAIHALVLFMVFVTKVLLTATFIGGSYPYS